MLAIAIALTLGALCGGMITVAHLLDKHDQRRLDRAALAEIHWAQFEELRMNTDMLGAVLASYTLTLADTVESLGRFAIEHERALRKRRT